MRARLIKMAAGLTAVSALAFGGAALAGATGPPASPPAPAAPAVSVQQGDQTAPDTGAASESTSEPASSESGSESATANDGPGGHADEPGNANANYEFQGEQ
jgi:hypothetical protein